MSCGWARERARVHLRVAVRVGAGGQVAGRAGAVGGVWAHKPGIGGIARETSRRADWNIRVVCVLSDGEGAGRTHTYTPTKRRPTGHGPSRRAAGGQA